MTSGHDQAEPATIKPVNLMKIADKKESMAFKDNIEHLEALEYSARLRLAMAYLRDGKASVRDLKQKHRLSSLMDKKVINEGSDLNLSSLSSGDVTLNDLGILLKRVETETRQKVQNALNQGVQLHFENFCTSYGLNDFERIVVSLLIANNTFKGFRDFYAQLKLDPHDRKDGGMRIGAILQIIFPDYRDQIEGRKYFSMNSTLIKHEIIILDDRYDNMTNILDMVVYLHERIVRYILGDDNIYDTDYQCISREKSSVHLDHVILPDNLKEETLRLAVNYTKNKSNPQKPLINEFYGYGTGLTFLFHGPSGTGKTMLAHALANSLNMELLAVDFAKSVQRRKFTEDLIKYVFKEAKLCNGIVFFDECDDVFDARSSESRTLLIEIEKTECITIMATNKVIELDPALDRRISMKVPFYLPDKTQRENIWKALVPPNIQLGKDVDFNKLAEDYIFTGGLIKNTLFMAITNSMPKNRNLKLTLTSKEIENAANHQSRSMFDLNGLGSVYSPRITIDELAIRSKDKENLRKLKSAYGKSRDLGMGMLIVLGCSDIQTGIDCVEAVAKGCELKVKMFSLSDLISGNNSSDKITDPFTQKEMSALDCALKTSTGHQTLTMFVDHNSSFKEILLKDRENENSKDYVLGFFDRLRIFKGALFLVTTPIKSLQLPIEFNYYQEIHLPPEELQIQKWETQFGNNKEIEDRIIDLVELHPLHLHEIDMVARHANMNAFLERGEGTITFDHVYDIIKRFKNMKKVPILFGSKR